MSVLTEEQKQDFVRLGYFVVPGLAPKNLCEKAIEAIEKRLASGWDEETGRYSIKMLGGGTMDGNFFSIFTQVTQVMNLLYTTRVIEIARSLLYNDAHYTCGPETDCAQIAYRFPDAKKAPHPLGNQSWHVDGLTNKKHSQFSLLVGVVLKDIEGEYAGNFCVHPGTHHEVLPRLEAWAKSRFTHFDHRVSTLEPVQINPMYAGDVVFAHQKLPHQGAPNYSDEIRRAVFFRLTHARHNEYDQNNDPHSVLLHDLFLEFEGVHDVVHHTCRAEPHVHLQMEATKASTAASRTLKCAIS